MAIRTIFPQPQPHPRAQARYQARRHLMQHMLKLAQKELIRTSHRRHIELLDGVH